MIGLSTIYLATEIVRVIKVCTLANILWSSFKCKRKSEVLTKKNKINMYNYNEYSEFFHYCLH